jgi:hypothetical protein
MVVFLVDAQHAGAKRLPVPLAGAVLAAANFGEREFGWRKPLETARAAIDMV